MGNIEALWHIMQRRLFLKVQIVVLFNSKHHFQLQLEWIYLYCLYLNKKNECDYTGRNFFQVCVLSTIWFKTSHISVQKANNVTKMLSWEGLTILHLSHRWKILPCSKLMQWESLELYWNILSLNCSKVIVHPFVFQISSLT